MQDVLNPLSSWIFHGPIDISSEIWLQSPKWLRGGGGGGQVFEKIDGQLNLSDLKQRSKNDYIIIIRSSSSHLAVYL